MRRSTIRTATVVAGAALALSAGALAPASAATLKIKDDRNDMKSGLDIRSVKLAHTKRQVVAKIKVRNIGRKSSGILGAYLDTKRKHEGSDYVTAIQLRKRDKPLVQLKKTKSNGTPTKVKKCKLNHRARFGKDSVILRVPRSCVGRPGKARIVAAARAGQKTDTAPNKGRWSSFVKRG